MPAMNPNPERAATWREAYAAGLRKGIAEHPEQYGPVVTAAVDAMIERMIVATFADTHNHGGHGFRNACRTVGIKHTRKAIRDYIEGR